MTLTILRFPDVKRKVGLSRSTIYSHVAKNQFPKPVPLGTNSVGWIEEEVNEWLEERINARKEHEDNSNQYQLSL